MSNQNQVPSGVLISGICMGARTEQDGDYINNDIIVKVGSRLNEAGEEVSNIELISLYGDDIDKIMQEANAAKGKHVLIPVIRRPARRDLQNSRMRNSRNRDTAVRVISS